MQVRDGEKAQGPRLLMPGGGGGGGGGGGSVRSENVSAAGPARALNTYPQFNPVMYQGMQPGALPALPGMGPAIASYMPAINGMQGFGGLPASQLVQALMSGYAGVPMATQPTGAQVPGMGTMPNPVPATGGGAGTGTGGGTGTPTETEEERRKRLKREYDATSLSTEGTTAES